MQILENVPLSHHSTMRLGGPAAYLAEAKTKDDIADAIKWAEAKNLDVIMIGDGSNIVWTDKGYEGLVLVDKTSGFEINGNEVTVAGGENWDDVVRRTVEAGLSGLEFLSLIPGTAGATPVQNVGAYGQEIINVLVSVEAYDKQTKKFVHLMPEECGFGYRTSRFKTTDHGRFFITSIKLRLQRGNPKPPFYDSLQKFLAEKNITEFTPATIRAAVIELRMSKMPDPAAYANNGSFFSNPIIGAQKFAELKSAYPQIVSWPTADGQVKLSAAWLIGQTGLNTKTDTETGMSLWPKHALVLVNEHATSTADLLKYKQKIVVRVKDLFGVTLEQEPELFGD